KLVPRLDARSRPDRELHHALRAAAAEGEADPRTDAPGDAGDPALPIVEDRVDREPHEHHVDRTAWVNDQAVTLRESGREHQAPKTAPVRRRRRRVRRDRHTRGLVDDDALHLKRRLHLNNRWSADDHHDAWEDEEDKWEDHLDRRLE